MQPQSQHTCLEVRLQYKIKVQSSYIPCKRVSKEQVVVFMKVSIATSNDRSIISSPGYVIRESEKGCDVTFIFSFPIERNSFVFCNPEFVHVLNEDGTPNPNMAECTRTYYEKLFVQST
mmetsp:Transcript_6092/g.7962  ORF Transcript_6092/g.7962 Transcript_6092/m.7962 type:complete len:119 (-) Transcript_6092:491-847(-)